MRALVVTSEMVPVTFYTEHRDRRTLCSRN